MVKLMESQATVNSEGTQKVIVDSFGATLTGTGLSGDGVPLVTMASDLSATITGVTTPVTYVGYNGQMFQDRARDAFAKSIRSGLLFS
jgi:hypothetical protein